MVLANPVYLKMAVKTEVDLWHSTVVVAYIMLLLFLDGIAVLF